MTDAISERVSDARFLWANGRREGALLCVLAAVAAKARLTYPDQPDGVAFRRLVKESHRWTMSVEYRGALEPVEQIFYKWMRCELVHRAGLPADIEWIEDVEPDALVVRAGGSPEFVLRLSPAWVDRLAEIALA